MLWQPVPGDRFAIDQPTLAGDVFWVSELTIEVHVHHGRQVLGFNGTTEWALDSVTTDEAVWLPREDQLRELLGDRFAGLDRTPAGWRVRVVESGQQREFEDADAECAYAKALLSRL